MSFAKNVLINCMGLKKDEDLVIVYDKNKRLLAQSFLDPAKLISNNIHFIETPVQKNNGDEPPKEVADTLLKADVALIITTKSFSHTEARRAASKKGVRIATMPGLTASMALRTLSADYTKIKDRCDKVAKLLKAKKLELITKKGTLLTVYINRLFKDTGIYTEKGAFGNLPAGEVGFAPVEGKTEGVVVIDKSLAGIGRLKDPIKLIIKDGFVIDIQGKKEAEKLKKLLKSFNNKKVYNIAEFAIGLNPKAKISGITLEDEKVEGTAHIALGDNTSYVGGNTKAPTHLDGVISKPKIIINKKNIFTD
ncbi:MAG: aminopeptidase [Nanoarchaeota archaeon]|nr:aminopeptidase [Nanoarchaeota archaeon]